MTAPVTDVILINITRDSVGVAKPGFGTALMLSNTVSWSGSALTRSYSSLAALAVDAPAGTPEYRAAQKLFAQSPKPPRVKIGKASNKPTMQYTIEAATVRNSNLYSIAAEGGTADDDAEYTSDSAATAAEIHNGLVTALNALTGKNFTAALAPLVLPDFTFVRSSGNILTAVAHTLQTGDGPFQATNSGGALPTGMAALTDYYAVRIDADTFSIATSRANAFAGTVVTLSGAGTGTHTIDILAGTKRPADPFVVNGDTAGAWFSLDIGTNGDLALALTHADPGVEADLDAILLQDADWYELLTFANSADYVEAAADWIESNKRLYLADVCNSVCITETVGAADPDDIAATLFDGTYVRTAVVWHSSPAEMLAAAWSGRMLPTEPGSASWFGKRLATVTPVNLTDTHRDNLRAKWANWYERMAGQAITFNGTVAGQDYIDVTRDLDWVEADMYAEIFGTIIANDKLDFDDPGIGKVESAMRATMQRATDRRIFTVDPAYTVEVPLAADVSDSDKQERTLPDCKAAGTLRGSIHKVRPVNISVSL